MGSSAVCFTVDVEDWIQSTLDFDAPITDRCRVNTERMLDAFAAADIRGTWFVQGLVAQRFPELVRKIADAGHEVACHAHTHRPLFSMSREVLREELSASRKAIEDATGQGVVGFRAPDFSLGEPCERMDEVDRKIFEELVRGGFRYDSSVVPTRMRRYGIAEAPQGPFRLREGLLEIPLTTLWLGRRWPALGGGYLRMFPFAFHQLALWQAARASRPAVVYLHPYELDPDELGAISRLRSVPWKLYLSQSLGRGARLHARIRRLREAATTHMTMRESAAELEKLADLPTV